MQITLDLYQLKNMMMDMSELGALNCTKAIEPRSDIISQEQAFKKFGRRTVQRWINKNVITHKRNGESQNSRKNYSYIELLACHRSEKLIKEIK
jgi:hypothetical protein